MCRQSDKLKNHINETKERDVWWFPPGFYERYCEMYTDLCYEGVKDFMCHRCSKGEIMEDIRNTPDREPPYPVKTPLMFKGNDAPVGFIPAVMLFEMGRAMKDGAQKHGGSFNWRKGDTQNLMYHCNAAISHILQFVEGEDVASDSKLSHLAHACAQLAVALDKMKYRNDVDDRPNNG